MNIRDCQSQSIEKYCRSVEQNWGGELDLSQDTATLRKQYNNNKTSFVLQSPFYHDPWQNPMSAELISSLFSWSLPIMHNVTLLIVNCGQPGDTKLCFDISYIYLSFTKSLENPLPTRRGGKKFSSINANQIQNRNVWNRVFIRTNRYDTNGMRWANDHKITNSNLARRGPISCQSWQSCTQTV